MSTRHFEQLDASTLTLADLNAIKLRGQQARSTVFADAVRSVRSRFSRW